MAVTFLTVDEVAAQARLSSKTVLRAVGRGELVAYKVGGRWRVKEGDFAAWVERGRFIPSVSPNAPLPEPVVPSHGSLAALRKLEAAP